MPRSSLLLNLALTLAAVDLLRCSDECDCPHDAGVSCQGVYADDRATDAVVTFPGSGATPQYTPACLRIRVGQSVTWNGDLAKFPLSPGFGGSANPIVPTSSGTTVTFVFPAGIYGFQSGNMSGVIYAEP